jgi:hypothetical protein
MSQKLLTAKDAKVAKEKQNLLTAEGARFRRER